MKFCLKPLSVVALMTILALPCAAAEEEEGGGKNLTRGQETLLLEKGGVLLPRHTLVVEPGLQYSHTSRTRISISGFTIFQAIVIGNIVSEDVERDILTGFVNLRYGLTNRVQLELKAPYLYREDEEVFAVGPSGEDMVKRDVDENGLGDIEGSILWHAIRENSYTPDIVFYLRGKSRTGKDPYGLRTKEIEGRNRYTELALGSGHWGLSAGANIIKASDPAVLFFNLGYFYNFERNVGRQAGVDYGRVKPGDSVEFGLGMAYALNERLSSSLSYQQRFSFEAEQNDDEIIDTDANAASLYFGSSYALSDRTAVSLSVGVGLTDDAPDTTLEIRVPFTF